MSLLKQLIIKTKTAQRTAKDCAFYEEELKTAERKYSEVSQEKSDKSTIKNYKNLVEESQSVLEDAKNSQETYTNQLRDFVDQNKDVEGITGTDELMKAQELLSQNRQRKKEKQEITDKVCFTFGVIADIQYANTDDAWDFGHTRLRRYRQALDSVTSANKKWMTNKPVSFVAQIGDIIDGCNKKNNQSNEALTTVLKEMKSINVPIYHAIGNHELYNFTRSELHSLLEWGEKSTSSSSSSALSKSTTTTTTTTTMTTTATTTTTSKSLMAYYAFSPYEGWRFLVLDPFDLAIIGWPKESARYKEADKMVRAHNPNLPDGEDWTIGLKGLDLRWLPYNGAIGDDQMNWLENQLTNARENLQRVVILTHVAIYPPSCAHITLLWNYKDVLDVLHKYPEVVAVFAGHDHDGGYGCDKAGIHHVTLQAPVECDENEVAFGTVHVYQNKLYLEGMGKIPSRELEFKSLSKI